MSHNPYEPGNRPRCALCLAELEPAESTIDGVEKVLCGFKPCPKHPTAATIYRGTPEYDSKFPIREQVTDPAGELLDRVTPPASSLAQQEADLRVEYEKEAKEMGLTDIGDDPELWQEYQDRLRFLQQAAEKVTPGPARPADPVTPPRLPETTIDSLNRLMEELTANDGMSITPERYLEIKLEVERLSAIIHSPGSVKFHELKSWPKYFIPILNGDKRFEIRNNDRDFRSGDHAILREYIPETGEYTGRQIHVQITYVTRGGALNALPMNGGLTSGWCVFGFSVIRGTFMP